MLHPGVVIYVILNADLNDPIFVNGVLFRIIIEAEDRRVLLYCDLIGNIPPDIDGFIGIKAAGGHEHRGEDQEQQKDSNRRYTAFFDFHRISYRKPDSAPTSDIRSSGA